MYLIIVVLMYMCVYVRMCENVLGFLYKLDSQLNFGIYFVINKITIFCNTIYSYHPEALCKVFNVAQFSKILFLFEWMYSFRYKTRSKYF